MNYALQTALVKTWTARCQPVSPERDGPVAPGPVGEVAEDDPQAVADELSNPRHDAGYESAGSEESQEGAGDAPGPFPS